MPIREYECDVCGRRFEKIQKFSDPPVEECPHCGGHVHKLISSPAFQFKGTGWYITDYAKKDTTGEKSAGESKDNGASKETTGSEKDSGTKKDASKKETSTTPASTSSETSTSTSKTKE